MMDPLSVAASVAGVAALAADLSKTLYTIYHDVKGAEKETEEIASSVSILSTVLKALEDVLRNDIQTYRPEFVLHVKGISDRCERIVKDIQAATAVKRGNNQKKSLLKKVAWCFQKGRVEHLQTSLESLKSTLNILLHVIGLARMIVGVASNGQSNTLGDKEVKEQRQLLTSLVIANRLLVEKLDHMEVEAQKHQAEGQKQQARSSRPRFEEKILYSTSTSEEVREAAQQKEAGGQNSHFGGQKQHVRPLRRESIERISSPSKTFPGPSEPARQDGDRDDQRDSLHGAASGSSLNSSEHGPQDEARPPLLYQPSRKDEDASHENNPEARTTLAEAYELINSLRYTPRTSQLLRSTIPHERHNAYLLRSPTTSHDQAERMVDRLLMYYTCVSVERHEDFPLRYDDPQRTRPYSDDSIIYVDGEPEKLARRVYHEREPEIFPRDMLPVDAMIQRMTFHQVEYYKLQEQNKNLEQELRFERSKQQVRQETLDSLKAHQDREAESRAAVENSKPLTLKDCLGRSFSLPIQACRSWQTMRSLITSSFLHIDALSPQIAQGSYDLLGPSGDIILPEVWESMVQPGWVVELRLRPQPDAARESLSPGVATPRSSPQAGSISDGRGSGSFHRHRPSLRGWLKGSRSSKNNVVVEDP